MNSYQPSYKRSSTVDKYDLAAEMNRERESEKLHNERSEEKDLRLLQIEEDKNTLDFYKFKNEYLESVKLKPFDEEHYKAFLDGVLRTYETYVSGTPKPVVRYVGDELSTGALIENLAYNHTAFLKEHDLGKHKAFLKDNRVKGQHVFSKFNSLISDGYSFEESNELARLYNEEIEFILVKPEELQEEEKKKIPLLVRKAVGNYIKLNNTNLMSSESAEKYALDKIQSRREAFTIKSEDQAIVKAEIQTIIIDASISGVTPLSLYLALDKEYYEFENLKVITGIDNDKELSEVLTEAGMESKKVNLVGSYGAERGKRWVITNK